MRALLSSVFFTFMTLAVAAALNSGSTKTAKKSQHHFVEIKKSKEQPKIKKRPKRKRKRLKNIRQAPPASPNLAITLDIPLEMPQVKDMHTEMLEQTVEVVPPAPKAGNQPPEYPQNARADGIQGRVVAMAHIDEYGFVIRTRILSSTPPGVFDSAVMAALRNWKFSPATLRGNPVDQWVEIPFNFVM